LTTWLNRCDPAVRQVGVVSADLRCLKSQFSDPSQELLSFGNSHPGSWINNAGAAYHRSLAEMNPQSHWQWLIAAPSHQRLFQVCQFRFCRFYGNSKDGLIINVIAHAAPKGLPPEWGLYCTSKAALEKPSADAVSEEERG